jgi:hypothetical protein
MYARSRALSVSSSGPFLPRTGAPSFLRRTAMYRAMRRLASLSSATLRVHASTQRVHQIDYFRWLALSWHFDLLAGLLLL